MKFKKLLVLSVLWLVGLSANAAVPEGVWTMPKPQGLEFTEFTDDGTRYYLFNEKANMFFASGNGWNTQASLRTFGMEIWLNSGSSEADAPEGTYELWDYNVNNPARTTDEHNMFTDDGDATWVDHGDQAHYYSWTYEIVNGCVRFQNASFVAAKTDYAGKYIGWDGTYVWKNEGSNGSNRNAYTAILHHVDPAAEGASVDFKAVTTESYENFVADEEAYNAYATGMSKYLAAMALREALVKAEEIGANVADQLAVYNNTESTLEELEEATKKVNEAIEEYEKEIANGDIIGATGENPKDASVWITNGTFDTIDDFHGWSGSGFGAGGDKSTNAERFGMNYDTYQDITIKYPGLYIFGVKGFYRAGSADESYQHYIANDEDARLARYYVTVGDKTTELQINNIFDGALSEEPSYGAMYSNGLYIPNVMTQANNFMHVSGLYGHLLPLEIEGSDVKVRIGVKKEKQLSNDWSLFDDFTLTFCGNKDDRYLGYVNTAVASYPSYENVIATQSYVDAYLAVKNNPVGTDKASAEAYIASLDAAKATLDENVMLWRQWEAKVAEAVNALELYSELDVDEYIDLIEYADESEESNKAKAIREARNLTNEELEAEIAEITRILTALEDAAKNQIQPGDDVTKFLTNPGFEDGTNGWTIVSKGGGNVQLGGNNDNHCFEAWHSTNFDIYQEVKDAPVGVYEISVKGYVRYLDGNEAINARNDQPEEIPIYVYLNDVKNQFANWFSYPKPIGYYKEIDSNAGVTTDEAAEEEFPNNMVAASIAFNEGGYENKASGLLANKGDILRIGVKGTPAAQFWPIWDDFKLIYKGFDIEYVKPELEKAIANAEAQMDKVFASDQKALLKTALDAAKEALNLTDGKDMFKVLSALVAVDVEAAIQKYKDFEAAVSAFESKLFAAESAEDDARPSDDVINAARELCTKAQAFAEGQEFTNADLDEMLKQMEEMTKKLGIPAAMDTASDENPANATSMITNPSYDGDSTDGWKRESATGYYGAQYTVCENYDGKFDVFQDLELPEGTYEVSVQAFYRHGSSVNDYKTFIEDPTANNNASLYVTAADGTTSVFVPRLATVAKEYTSYELDENNNFKAEADYAWVVEQADLTVKEDSTEATGLEVPNMRIAVNELLESDPSALKSSIIFKVGADGKARIGIVKTVEVGTDWTAWDNWKLTYYGKNSNKETGVKGVSTMSDVVKTEVFNLNGTRVNSGKGIVIVRQTLNDGTVRVKKLMVK